MSWRCFHQATRSPPKVRQTPCAGGSRPMRRFLPLGSRVQSGNVPQRQDRGPDMIRLLSAVGRATVIVVAVLTIVGFAIGGYGMGTGEYHGSFASAVPQGAGGVVGAVVG